MFTIAHRTGTLLLELLRDDNPVGVAVFDNTGDFLVFPSADSIGDGFTVEATEVSGEPVVLARVSVGLGPDTVVITDEHDLEIPEYNRTQVLSDELKAVRLLMGIIHDRGVQLALCNLGYSGCITLPEDRR